MRYSLFCLLAPVLFAGCANQPIPDNLGIPEAIQFRSEGEPVDVVDALPAALHLSDAVMEAVRHDPSLQASLARLYLAISDAKQSRLLPNPVLSIVARFPSGGGSPTIEAGLTAELLGLLNRPNQINAADHRLRAAGADVLTTTLDLIAQTQERFIAVQSIEAELAALERQQALVTRLLSGARARVEAGESSRVDVLSLDAERVQSESAILDAQSRRRDERLALARLMGRPSGEIEWNLTPWTAPPDAVDEALLIPKALEHRPEVQSHRWELAALNDDAASANWPINLGDVGVDAERDGGEWSVGPSVALPIPIFDFGQSRRQKAAAAQAQARHELVRAQREVIEETRRATAHVRSSRAALAKVRDELIPLLERRQEQITSAYQLGEANITTVLLGERELQTARARLIELEQRVAMSHVRLSRAIGIPVELNERLNEQRRNP